LIIVLCCVEVLTLVFDMLSMEIDAKLSVILHVTTFGFVIPI